MFNSSSCSSSTSYVILEEQVLPTNTSKATSKSKTRAGPLKNQNLSNRNNVLPLSSTSLSSLNTYVISSTSSIKSNRNGSSADDLLRSFSGKTFTIPSQKRQLQQMSTDSLKKESEKLLQPGLFDEDKKPTIFDLKLEDRKKVANLICKLAQTQEKLENLQTQRSIPHETADKSTLVTDVTSDQKLRDVLRQNQLLTAKLVQLQEQNTSLSERCECLDKKFSRCSDDNQRLKWILRTIQQREEILLQNNRCLKSDRDKPLSSAKVSPKIDPMESANVTSSKSSKRVFVNETMQTTPNLELGHIKSFERKSRMCLQSGDCHQGQISDAHLVIPSTTTLFETTELRNHQDSKTGLKLSKPTDEEDILKELFFNF
ncbi:unnamed protein product [Allacma fusca]|uniref:Uncharacterized protein n=1 Tax=Allacma fusca TaxID=39272 RepID=A0A8J2L955_9HEXA|nr:unnamed protein product [Allacma fusca]